MSQLTLTILDSRRSIHSHPHYRFAEAAIAALSADPETIEELDAALLRFETPIAGKPGFFDSWSVGVDDRPYDGGVCVIDLAARLVVSQNSCFAPGSRGEVALDDRQGTTQEWLPFTVAADWLFIHDMSDWQKRAAERRRERQSRPRLDFRAVLFGPALIDFLVQECQLSASAAGDDCLDEIVAIHARWLLTPRDDLQGRCPRDWLLADRDHIESDLQWRDQQWSMQGACPPALSRQTCAYRLGGCGTHEVVLYYDLVRFLLTQCWELCRQPPGLTAAECAVQLTQQREWWLDTPQPEDLHGKCPRQVIDDERRRIPQAISGAEAIVDHDCPLCRMMAEMPGPMFWHLDGGHMEDEFAFSFLLTREEWENEQKSWAEARERWEREKDQLTEGPASPWQSSYSNPAFVDGLPHAAAKEVLLMGLGCHLAELIQDCRDFADGGQWRDRLHRDFGNLTAAMANEGESVVTGVVCKLQGTLDDLGDAHNQLAAKCDDLAEQLDDMIVRLATPRG